MQAHNLNNRITRLEFFTLCQELTIDPCLAMENETIREELLGKGDSIKIKRILESEF
jgi:hypothetical protein